MVSKLLAPAFVLVLAGLTAAPAFAGNEDVRGEDALVSGVSYFAQTHPLSCEAAALQMALSHEGLTPSQDDILALIPVDSQPDADPFTAFVGDVNGSEVDGSGYGTYYPTIASAAHQLGGRVLWSGQGLSAGQVYQALREGHPVVAWVSYDYASHPRTDYAAFDGAVIPYAGAVEHAVTLVGLAPGQVLIFDPDQGSLWLARSTFETAYQTFDEMAVELA